MTIGVPPSPVSPCVRNCCLDADDVCLGCGRHLREITAWQVATPEQRAHILARAAERIAQLRDRQSAPPGT